MALVKFKVTMAAMKKVKTIIGSTPASTTVNVMGIKTDVSSVPGIKPIIIYKITAPKAANVICNNGKFSIMLLLIIYYICLKFDNPFRLEYKGRYYKA